MRHRLVVLHLWLGLTLGLFWALQGFSGALLVFHRDFIRFSEKRVIPGPLPSLDLVQRKVQERVGGPVTRIAVFDGGSDFLVADFKDHAGTGRSAWIDADQANVRSVFETDPALPYKGSFWRWVYHYHEAMAAGRRGQALVAISGLTLLSSVGVGLWLGWPKRKKWRAAFSYRKWKSRDQRLYGWHRAVGLSIGSLLFITIPCGTYLIYAAEIRDLVARVVPHQLPYRAPAETAGPTGGTIGPQTAYEVARTHFPDAAFVSIAMPEAARPVYTVRLRQPSELRRWAGLTSVTLDARTGETLHVYDAARAPLSNRILDAAYPVHNGEIAGLAGRLLVMLAGSSLPLLYVTGLWTWSRRYKRKRGKWAQKRMPNGDCRTKLAILESARPPENS